MNELLISKTKIADESWFVVQKYSGRANYEGQMILLTPPKLIFLPRKFSMSAAKVRLHKRVILCDFTKFLSLWDGAFGLLTCLLSGIEKQQVTPQSIFF